MFEVCFFPNNKKLAEFAGALWSLTINVSGTGRPGRFFGDFFGETKKSLASRGETLGDKDACKD
jgi:hypothetical protein